jgi:hypothetical protein
MSLRKWLNHSFLTKRRLATRRPAGGFSACHWTDSGVQHDLIRDISATGLYLLTRERWRPGTTVSLTLQRAGLHSENLERQITLQARAVRCDEAGVGLAFEIPPGMEQQLWVNLVESSTRDATPGDIVGPFKLAKALAFLSRISFPSGTAIRQEIRTTLTGHRLWNAIEVALHAESLLASWPDWEQLRCCPPVLLRILHDGSWADEDLMQQCWAGLLATACTETGDDESNRDLVDIFSQLTPTHVRLVTAACTNATKFLTESGVVAARELTCTTDEIMKLSGTRDLLRMGRSLEHLSELGLLEQRFKTSLFVPVVGVNITPTPLGLALSARCHGHRGASEAFYGLNSAGSVVAVAS